MGSHSSKAAKGDVVGQEAAAPAAEAAGGASPSKSNGQENGHIKINGDVSPKVDGDPAPLNGNGSAEPVKEEAKVESGNGDTIEPAPVAESGDAKPAGAPKETPKKKKKFSFKKPFKLSGISFRKTKKDSADTSAVSSPTEEPRKEEAKAEEEEEAAAGVTGETDQAGATKEEEEKQEEEATATVVASAPPSAPEPEVAAEREAGSEGQAEEPEKPQLASDVPEETKAEEEEEEVSKPAEAESSSAPVEQKEE